LQNLHQHWEESLQGHRFYILSLQIAESLAALGKNEQNDAFEGGAVAFYEGRFVPASAFGTSGISADRSHRSVFSALQVSLLPSSFPIEPSFSAHSARCDVLYTFN